MMRAEIKDLFCMGRGHSKSYASIQSPAVIEKCTFLHDLRHAVTIAAWKASRQRRSPVSEVNSLTIPSEWI